MIEEKDMEEVLVWVMGDAAGVTRVLIGSFGDRGVIYYCEWADGEVDRGTYRTAKAEYSVAELCSLTKRSEDDGFNLILPPTVLQVVPPPLGSGRLNEWVGWEILPTVETLMVGV